MLPEIVKPEVKEPKETIERDDDILTVDEVAAWLRVTKAWVRAHSSKKRRPHLPCFRAGKYIRFRRGTLKEAVSRWLKADAA